MYVKKDRSASVLLILFMVTALWAQPKAVFQGKADEQLLSLDQCIELALHNNHQAKISVQALKIAEAQYKQVMSSYWPSITASANFIRLDESPHFVYPEETSGYMISGLFPQPIDVEVTVPEKHTKIMDRTNGVMSLDFIYPLYLGGRRSALADQAIGQIKVRQQEKRRSDLQIVYEVTERYYGNVLAKKLYTLGKETVDRVDVTLELTEQMYQKGAGKVKKTDYLKSKIFASSMHALLASLKNNLELSSSALQFTISDKNKVVYKTADTELPYKEISRDYLKDIPIALSSNPDWLKMEEAVKIFHAKLDEAESEYMLNVALIGQLRHIENKYEAGAVSEADKNSWMIGLGVQIPVFSGFGTTYKVQEMNARLSELKEKQFLLKDALSLQLKMEMQKIHNLQIQIKASHEAMKSAVENRELTERAYNIEMASAEDMIQSQLFESLMIAQYYKTVYDHIMAKAKLDVLMAKEQEHAYR